MKEIKQLISQKNWNFLFSNYSIKEICLLLNFSEAMHLIKSLCYDDIQDDETQLYSLKFAFAVQDYFNTEWEKDWKNDVFLGDLCEAFCLYDERYFCYKKAYNKLKDPPAELLLLLSNCNSAPGIPPITDEEAEFYLKRAAEKKITSETALMMRALYQHKRDLSQIKHWDKIYQKLENENIHADFLIPDIFK